MIPTDIQDFEKSIQTLYENGEIRAPIHLRDNNEKNLIDIFQSVKPEDYVFSTWASHTHALLKGVPPEVIKKEIKAGRSITLHFPDHNFYSSAIVGGTAPIALGVSKALLQKKEGNRVFCFIGDMAFHTGIVNECIRYSIGHDLPLTWVIEDNGKSVGTDTETVCGIKTKNLYVHLLHLLEESCCENVDLIYYNFTTAYPHSGTGTFVAF